MESAEDRPEAPSLTDPVRILTWLLAVGGLSGIGMYVAGLLPLPGILGGVCMLSLAYCCARNVDRPEWRRKGAPLTTVALVLYVVAMVMSLTSSSAATEERIWSARERTDFSVRSSLPNAVGHYRLKHKRMPPDLEQVRMFWEPDTEFGVGKFGVDGWDRPVRFAVLAKYTYELRSAGPDGVFKTEDDLVYRTK